MQRSVKHLARRPGQRIFAPRTIHDEWAFHNGGRSELQFNIGLDPDIHELRHGVAFSFETSRSMRSIDGLIERVKYFNEYMAINPKLYYDMRMWHHKREGTSWHRSPDNMPGLIAPELATEGVFVFLGRRQSIESVDYDIVLADFDRLLPLYKYVESEGAFPPIPTLTSTTAFTCRSGISQGPAKTTATQSEKQLDVDLRHNVLRSALAHQLATQYGAENVRTEQPTGVGTLIDVAVRHQGEFWFYEIKTYHSPRACLREAVCQLLEYAFWPRDKEVNVSRLIIVGENKIDNDSEEYLHRIREKFSLRNKGSPPQGAGNLRNKSLEQC